MKGQKAIMSTSHRQFLGTQETHYYIQKKNSKCQKKLFRFVLGCQL